MIMKIFKKTICCFTASAAILALILSLNLFSLPVFALSDQHIMELMNIYKQKILEDPLSECYKNLVPAFDLELMDFLKFLETNFQNKSSNNSLANTAIARYNEYKNDIEDLFSGLYPKSLTENQPALATDEITAFNNCLKIKDEYIVQAKNKMIDHIKNTNAQKRTTVMLEKYQAINDQLRNLNLQISKLYGLFMAFKNKLPGFLQECIH